MRGRAVGVVEVKRERHCLVNGLLQLLRGRDVFKPELYRTQCGGSDGEQKRAFLPALGADHQNVGPAEIRETEASKGKAFLQRGCWQMNASQEVTRRENIGMVARDKCNHRNFARLSTPRPKCANAFQ